MIDVNYKNSRMKYLLSFSVGAILGDIFFHLLPESYHGHMIESNDSEDVAYKRVGLSVVIGIFVFNIVEMLLEKWSSDDCRSKEESHPIQNTVTDSKTTTRSLNLKNNSIIESASHMGISENNNNNCLETINLNSPMKKTNDELKRDINEPGSKKESDVSIQVVDASGYLNLIANGFDNFTHGLAIGASFLVGAKVGFLTTFIIFIHEIPHEICDYAILVNSGFSRSDAVKAQSSVSLFGLLGTAASLYVKSIETLNAKTVWILPFSTGGFLYIALVNLLPEILNPETSFRESLRQVACVMLGATFMAILAAF